MSYPLRLLMIEDSESDAFLAVRALRRAGYAPELERVDSAAGLRAALQSKEWDLILCDHNMPQFNELEALRMLSERDLQLPFVVISRDMLAQEVVTALKAGAHEFINKRDLGNIGVAVERAMREVSGQLERQRAQEALRQSEERYALAVRGSRDGLWDWDIQTDQVYYSPRFSELLGFTGNELGAALDSLLGAIHDADRGAFEHALDQHLKQRVPFDIECRLHTSQRECRWFILRGQALWGDDGKATRMAGSLSDVTDRKLAQEGLREKLQVIEQQQDAIRTLSAPIIEVWEGTLTMPVFGTIDAARAEQMMIVLLDAIVRTRCRHAIIDLTGVDAVDEQVADHIIKLIRAVQLIGAQGIVVGINPEVARAMVAIGVNLSHVPTLANLREALVVCMRAKGGGGRTRAATP